jgi:biopolymer transport protein ExbD
MKFARPDMRKARIEIIPMIDTIFFLLVFFMFTSLSMVKMKGMGVSVPKDAPNQLKPPPVIVVTVDKNSQYYIGRTSIDPSDLESDLQDKITANPKAVIVVNIDRIQPVQALVTVMDAVDGVSTPSGDSAAVTIATQPVNYMGFATQGGAASP